MPQVKDPVYEFRRINANIELEKRLVDLPKIVSRIKEILHEKDLEF
jgi:hypothetical protein